MHTSNSSGTKPIDSATLDQLESVMNSKPEPKVEQPTQPKEKVRPKVSKGAIAKVSDEMQGELGKRASKLVKADQTAKRARIQDGIREGYEQAQDIRLGQQIGMLTALERITLEDTRQIIEQRQMLRSHSDETTDISELFAVLDEEGTDPLEALPTTTDLLPALPSSKDSFKIFES